MLGIDLGTSCPGHLKVTPVESDHAMCRSSWMTFVSFQVFVAEVLSRLTVKDHIALTGVNRAGLWRESKLVAYNIHTKSCTLAHPLSSIVQFIVYIFIVLLQGERSWAGVWRCLLLHVGGKGPSSRG